MMEIIYADADMMAALAPYLSPGWWIVDIANKKFFDGPYQGKDAAFERYQRLPSRMRRFTTSDIEDL
jgi:hypothetical protein